MSKKLNKEEITKEKLSKLIESAIKGEGKDVSYQEFKEWLTTFTKVK